MSHILEITNLSKTYAKSDFALKQVSFTVPYGAIMGFVGENGAGKTTTIQTVLNIIRKDSGSIKVLGQELTDERTDLREEIGVVFDAANFPPMLTAAQLARVLGGVYRHWDDDRFTALLEQFQLPSNRKIKHFSRGMTMKLAIAAALSHHPKLLILDEATSGLDPIVRDEILDVFLDFVGDESHAILLSSHITSDLEKIADYITFIHQGKTLLTAQKDDLIYRYGIARCTSEQFARLDATDMLSSRKKDYQIDALLPNKEAVARKHKELVIDTPTIDEIMILLVKGERAR